MTDNNNNTNSLSHGVAVCLLSKRVLPTVGHVQESIFVLVFGIDASHGSTVRRMHQDITLETDNMYITGQYVSPS